MLSSPSPVFSLRILPSAELSSARSFSLPLPASFDLCVSLSLSPFLSSACALFWLTGPAVEVSQERAPHPRPEWKLAQVSVRARPGKMKAGEGWKGMGGLMRQLCVCTFESVFAWLDCTAYPWPLCSLYICCFFLLLHFHFCFLSLSLISSKWRCKTCSEVWG